MSSYFKLGMDKKLIVPYADYLKAMKPDFEYVGDKKEIIDVIRCLELPSVNSVKIVSTRGAGATALLDALAHHQHDDFMPDNFMVRPLFKFNGNNLFNTSDAKAVEARFQTALEELQRYYEMRLVKPVLIIDDGCNFVGNAPQHVINNFVEATVTADYIDAVVAVDRKKEDEFNAKHPEFTNSFTTKDLKEPDSEQIIKILKSRAKVFAAKGITIEDETLQALVGITQRYKAMYGTAQPNRSIRLLDSAATSFHMEVHSMAPGTYEKSKLLKMLETRITAKDGDEAELASVQSQLDTLKIELGASEETWKKHRETIKAKKDEIREFDILIAGVQAEINSLDAETRKHNFTLLRKHFEAVSEGDPSLKGRPKSEILRLDEKSLLDFAEFDLNIERNPKVSTLDGKISQYTQAIQKKQEELAKMGENIHGVTIMPGSEVEKTASIETKTPVGGVSGRLKENLMNGMALMKESVFGQDEILEPIVASLRRAAAGLNDPDRPLGNFIIPGPPGVGKSWIGKQLAIKLFGSADYFAEIDMEKYQEKHTVSSLLGAPPGYAGYGTIGKLVEIGQKMPFGVLLLDEIEKAHPDIRQALLKVKGSGRLVGFDNEEADFRNIIIVESSNYGQDLWVEHDFATAEKLLLERMRKDTTVFSPEYLDRADAILCARRLDEDALTSIVARQVKKLQTQAAVRNPQLVIDVPKDHLLEFVRAECAGVSGRRAEMMINKIVGDPLTNVLLGQNNVNGVLAGRFSGKKFDIAFTKAAANGNGSNPAAQFSKLAVS